MRRLVLYAHHDRENRLRHYVRHMLTELTRARCQTVFISTSPLGHQDVEIARRAGVQDILLRPNRGYDFASWRDGLTHVSLDAWDEIILMNSSLVGPLYPFGSVFVRAPRQADIWGITENNEIQWHLQSYFLAVRQNAFRLVQDFFKRIIDLSNIDQVVTQYEVGLSQAMKKAGLHLAPLVPLHLFRNKDTKALENVTLRQPVEAIQHGMPFVKVRLLKENPHGIPLSSVHREMQVRGFDLKLLDV